MIPRPDQLRVVVHGALGGAFNMAVDDVLLEGRATAFPYTLRFYGWRVPTVSVGYAQRWREGFDPEAPGVGAARLVRRRTGGRAVMHAHELTYAIVGPAQEGPLAGGVQETYRRVSTGLARGLSAIGIDAALERSRGRRDRQEPGACFGSRALYELGVGGDKLLGSAQRRTQHRVLQHGSLPLWSPDPRLWRLLGPSGVEAAAHSVGVRDVARPFPGRRRLIAALADGVAHELGLAPRLAGLSRAEVRAAVGRVGHYRNRDHTYRV